MGIMKKRYTSYNKRDWAGMMGVLLREGRVVL